MFYSEDHLRITKIRTTDGTTPIMGPDDKSVKKIVFAPNTPTARKLFEDQNTRLPNGLKMKIELIPAYKPEPVTFTPAVDEEKEAMRKELEELRALKAGGDLKQTGVEITSVTDDGPVIVELTKTNGQTKATQHASK